MIKPHQYRYVKATLPDTNEIFEIDIINYLKRLGSTPPNESKEILKPFKVFLEKKKNNPSEKNALGLDEYFYWVESKLQKRPMTSII